MEPAGGRSEGDQGPRSGQVRIDQGKGDKWTWVAQGGERAGGPQTIHWWRSPSLSPESRAQEEAELCWVEGWEVEGEDSATRGSHRTGTSARCVPWNYQETGRAENQ